MYFNESGILCEKADFDGQEYKLIVLPHSALPMVLNALQKESGHFGIERTASQFHRRFYYPGYAQVICDYIFLEGTPVTCRGIFQHIIGCYGNFRVGLILHWSVWMVSAKCGLPKVIFEWDLFYLFILVFVNANVFCKVHTLWTFMVQKGILGETCPRNECK